jgi:hypothetical protein
MDNEPPTYLMIPLYVSPYRPESFYGIVKNKLPQRRRRRRTQQSANMMRNKSMSFKLDNIIVFTIY